MEKSMETESLTNHIRILEEELVCALGCTEPIAVALAAALARGALGCDPETLSVACSGNIIKNVKSVTVPNSGGLRGIEAAAVLGAVGGDATRALEVLEAVDEADIARAHELLGREICSVELAEDVPNLYVSVRASADGHEAVATLAERHTNVVELTRDDEPVEVAGIRQVAAAEDGGPGDEGADRDVIDLATIWQFVHEVDVARIEGVVGRQLELNEAISNEGLAHDWGANIGSTMMRTRPDDITCRARAKAAAGSDARMSGCALPVVINSGSGNQGITCSMPVLEYGRYLGSSHDDIIRATALSNLVSVHVKKFIGELSAFCGAVSAAAGAGAAICYLRGGSFEDCEASIVNTLANVGGIVCDGAKPSCAAKISAAVDAAILGCDMALAHSSFKPGDGLVGSTAEQTIRSMGYVGRIGMHPTDIEILNIMIGKTKA